MFDRMQSICTMTHWWWWYSTVRIPPMTKCGSINLDELWRISCVNCQHQSSFDTWTNWSIPPGTPRSVSEIEEEDHTRSKLLIIVIHTSCSATSCPKDRICMSTPSNRSVCMTPGRTLTTRWSFFPIFIGSFFCCCRNEPMRISMSNSWHLFERRMCLFESNLHRQRLRNVSSHWNSACWLFSTVHRSFSIMHVLSVTISNSTNTVSLHRIERRSRRNRFVSMSSHIHRSFCSYLVGQKSRAIASYRHGYVKIARKLFSANLSVRDRRIHWSFMFKHKAASVEKPWRSDLFASMMAFWSSMTRQTLHHARG